MNVHFVSGEGFPNQSNWGLDGVDKDVLLPDEVKISVKQSIKTYMKSMKTLFGILTLTTALAVQVQAQTFLTNGLVAYYPFMSA